MDLGPICSEIHGFIKHDKFIGPKSMNFIRRLNRGNFYFSNHSFQNRGEGLIKGLEVMK